MALFSLCRLLYLHTRPILRRCLMPAFSIAQHSIHSQFPYSSPEDTGALDANLCVPTKRDDAARVERGKGESEREIR